MNVLLIEDDIQLNTTITNFLQYKEYMITSSTDGDEALSKINTSKFDLYIIDINIPNINGLEVVKFIRQKDMSVPIIMITASLELKNFKTAFENGCNEYIKKPFHLEELEIRINNLMKTSDDNSSIKISDSISYDLEYEELLIDKEVVKLRKKERRLLSILLQNPNKTVPIEPLENYVWENEIKESYPLRQLVCDLRKKFNTGQKFIFADKGLGYRFEIKN